MAKKKNDFNILAQLPPAAKKGQLITIDFEMFDMTKLHRPTGSFALISVKLQGDPDVYQLYDEKDLRKLEGHRQGHVGIPQCDVRPAAVPSLC